MEKSDIKLFHNTFCNVENHLIQNIRIIYFIKLLQSRPCKKIHYFKINKYSKSEDTMKIVLSLKETKA